MESVYELPEMELRLKLAESALLHLTREILKATKWSSGVLATATAPDSRKMLEVVVKTDYLDQTGSRYS